LVQKLARSDKQMYFFPEDQAFLVQKLGYYTDLQSVNSEDALVWSYFGPLAYATPDVRGRWAGWLVSYLGCVAASKSARSPCGAEYRTRTITPKGAPSSIPSL
jgi:hypothetical protein